MDLTLNKFIVIFHPYFFSEYVYKIYLKYEKQKFNNKFNNKHQTLTLGYVFSVLVEKAEELNLFLDPEVIITDFKLAALNAISSVLGPHEDEVLFFSFDAKHMEEVARTEINKCPQNKC